MRKYPSSILAIFICLCVVLCAAGCGATQSVSRFGMDLMDLNPLIVTSTNHETGETFFSRDPSNISAAISLFRRMELTEAGDTTDDKGISFTLATMYGDFSFGEYTGDRLRVVTKEYYVSQDFTVDVRLLAERIAAETNNIQDVSREKILAVHPYMTYQELIDSFGKTLNATTSDQQITYLYRYHNRPFYIGYKRETDNVGLSGETLMRGIFTSYNLGDELIPPTPLPGGHLESYRKAFSDVINACIEKSPDAPEPDELIINTRRLVHLSSTERRELVAGLGKQFDITVMDIEDAALYRNDNYAGNDDTSRLVVWIDFYTHIDDHYLEFVVAGNISGYPTTRIPMEYKLA